MAQNGWEVSNMAVRKNIGKITSAIESGIRAYNHIDFGPNIPNSINDIEGPMSDWTEQDMIPDKFIFGEHKWGRLDRKVAK